MGMVALGRMGIYMVKLCSSRAIIVSHETAKTRISRVGLELGASETPSLLKEFVQLMATPRTIWLMVPAAVIDGILERLVPLLQTHDVIIDGGYAVSPRR